MANGFSDDAIFNGLVRVRQHTDGYRFSMEALLLAWYAWAVPGRRALELGTGSGVVSLALAHKRGDLSIDAVELQPALAGLARYNVRHNSLDNVNVVEADLKTLQGPRWAGRYDLVFSNPPFRAVGKGRLNPHPEKAASRHELNCTLDDVLSCSVRCLKPAGTAVLILLAQRRAELEETARRAGLQVTQATLVHSLGEGPPVLIMAALSSASTDAGSPRITRLCIAKQSGADSDLMKAVFEGRWNLSDHPLG